MEAEELIALAEEKVQLGKELIERLQELQHIDGVQKVQRKITQEIKFLEKIVRNQNVQVANILCSNLTHFKSLVAALQKVEGLKHVDYPVPVSSSTKTLRIDIVCDNGASWVKVIARNPKSIRDTVEGKSSYGAKSILDQAEEIVEAAGMNPHLYKAPRVLFLFANQIDDELAEELHEIGVEVQELKDAGHLDEKVEIAVLNLDVTTLIAYVSSLCNGGQDVDFSDRILNQQAEMERRNPMKPCLDQLFSGKKLICCETAVNSFKEIVNLLGGPGEKQRTEQLLAQISIHPDTEIAEELRAVSVTGQVKERSLKIFSFGLQHRAINVTANEGFYRSVKMQGVDMPVFLHEARALTELKEQR